MEHQYDGLAGANKCVPCNQTYVAYGLKNARRGHKPGNDSQVFKETDRRGNCKARSVGARPAIFRNCRAGVPHPRGFCNCLCHV